MIPHNFIGCPAHYDIFEYPEGYYILNKYTKSWIRHAPMDRMMKIIRNDGGFQLLLKDLTTTQQIKEPAMEPAQ